MLEILALITIIAAFLLIPSLTGYMAKGLGRSFKKWFLLGCLLPIVSLFVLLLLPDKTKQKSIEVMVEK